ncbi:hypothetical protein ACWGBV_10890 [Streptomyces sp. NPDC055051]
MTYVSDATPPASGSGREPHPPRRPTRAGLPTTDALTTLLAEAPLAEPPAAPPEPQDATVAPPADAAVVPSAEAAAESAVLPLADAAVAPPATEAPTAPRPAAPGPRLRPPFVDSPAEAGTSGTGAPGARRPDGEPGGRPRLGAVPLPEAPRAAARRRDLPVVRAVRLVGAPAEPRPAPGESPAPAAVTPVPLPLPRAPGTAAVPNESRTEEPQP